MTVDFFRKFVRDKKIASSDVLKRNKICNFLRLVQIYDASCSIYADQTHKRTCVILRIKKFILPLLHVDEMCSWFAGLSFEK